MEDDSIKEELRSESKLETKKTVPQAEVHLYVRGQGPLHVLKCPLGGWDEDKLDLLQLMDDYGLKALYAFNPSTGRGLPLRYNPRNGLSMLSYRGKQVCIDGEPKEQEFQFQTFKEGLKFQNLSSSVEAIQVSSNLVQGM